ncbi:hypothetical protein KFE25_009406 [Diacronema lutheri]|uniref:Fe2OG dioxygenase domain-containing protein n=1 Tax=Diacronema lutheri TaxID=2081491 RepID=A0A8J5XZS4_DIALT|nr:hypothetical protein KFE25_009406 [Diacronema lutheri]
MPAGRFGRDTSAVGMTETVGASKARRQLQRRLAALARVCARAGLEPLPRSAGARALVVLHGGLDNRGATHMDIDAALRAIAPGAALWHSTCGLWTCARCATPAEALAVHDVLHALPLSALPRHALVVALVDDGAVGALLARECAAHAPVKAARVPGLALLEEYIDEAEQARLVRAIDVATDAWEARSDGGRCVRHYGLRFDYATARADTSGERPPWPAWCAELSARLVADGIAPCAPDQITVNSYRPGEGIPWHCDTHSAFGRVICSLSLLADIVMRFRGAAEPGEPPRAPLAVRLPRRSLLVLAGDARYGWEHSISARTADFDPDGLPRARKRRLSITFRRAADGVANGRTAPPCACRWPQLCDSQGAGRQPLSAPEPVPARCAREPSTAAPPPLARPADAEAGALRMRALRRADARALTALAVAQRWDSPESDVQLALELAARDPSGGSAGAGLFTRTGELVCCAILLRLDARARPRTSWLSSVITDERWRRRGLARRLVSSLLVRAGADAVGLFGSSCGQPLYTSLGFEPLLAAGLYELRVGAGDAPTAPADAPDTPLHVGLLSAAELRALVARETAARAAAMVAWFDAAPHLACAARSSGEPTAVPLSFALGRHWLDGSVFIGPLVASPELAEPARGAAARVVLAATIRTAATAPRPDGSRTTRVLVLALPASQAIISALGFVPVPGADVQFMLRPPPAPAGAPSCGAQSVGGMLAGGHLPQGELLAAGYDLA